MSRRIPPKMIHIFIKNKTVPFWAAYPITRIGPDHNMEKSATSLGMAVFLSVLVSVQCSRFSPERASDEAVFLPLLVETIQLNERLSGRPDSLAVARQDLFRRHGVEQEEFKSWVERNKGNIDLWDELMEKVKQSDAGLDLSNTVPDSSGQ